MKLVFTDTNILFSIFCFPDSTDKRSLASEIADCVEAEEVELLITRAVANELENVIAKKARFRHYLPLVQQGLEDLGIIEVADVSREEYARITAVCYDPDDVAITASAIALRRMEAFDYLLSNDFENFHSDAMKHYLHQHGIEPISMFALLKLLGKR